MQRFKSLKNLIKNNLNFFENYINISLLLNASVIALSAIYESGLNLSLYGQIIGALFLFTFFFNLGLVYLSDLYIFSEKEIKTRLLTYGYLILSILTITTLFCTRQSSGALLPSLKRQKYDPLYYIMFCFAIYISYFDYRNLKLKEMNKSGKIHEIGKNHKILISFSIILFLSMIVILFYLFFGGYPKIFSILINYLPVMIFIPVFLIFGIIFIILLFKFQWKRNKISLSIVSILKITLIALSILIFIFVGILAVNLLTSTGPHPLITFYSNMVLPYFFPSLLLLIPTITMLLHKSIPHRFEKMSKTLSLIGLFLTISFALPYLSAPVSVVDANHQFADVFGKNWNKFDPRVNGKFSDMPHVLIHSWFGEPDLDPDSWKLDAKNVYKETEDYTLKYDVYYPGKIAAQFIGKKGTIIYLHGGGWSAGHRKNGDHYMKYFAAQGYVCFAISYRLVETEFWNSPDKSYVGDYNIENIMRDIANFTQYLAAMELEDKIHGADLDNVFIIGQSAGAHLAAVTGFGYNDDEWGLDQRLKIKGIILFFPPNDVRNAFYGNSLYGKSLYNAGISKYKTPDEDPKFFDLYTPSKLVDHDDPACLIIHGTSDYLVAYTESEDISKACKKEDVDVILIKYYFIGHSFDISVLFKRISVYYIERFIYLIKED